MSKLGRQAVNRAILADPDLAYVVRKINEMGTAPPPVPPVEPQPVDTRLVEIATRWNLLNDRERNELHGLFKLMLYLDAQK
jgi:hypothetical protein